VRPTGAVRIEHGGVIKLMVTGGVLGFERTLDVQQFSEDEMRTVVEEAKRSGLKVMAHAEALAGTLAALRAGWIRSSTARSSTTRPSA
jgi:imidazolonepropionase-like amidohydrolase